MMKLTTTHPNPEYMENEIPGEIEPDSAAGSVLRKDMGIITRMVEVPDHEATGQLMRKNREKVGISLRELARQTKLSAPYISDLELGRRNWNEEVIERISSVLLKAQNDQR